MQLLGQLGLASAALATLASANPVQKRGQAFSVAQEANHAFKARNGTLAYAKALGKYGARLPAAVAAAASDDGTVPATPEQYDVEYLCPVTIGGQTLNLDFDTGSSDLWVISSELPKSAQANHAVYNPAKSSTFSRIAGATWSISYGDGSSASGDVGTDFVQIGATTFKSQVVELAKRASSSFTSGASDGLLGLAFSAINTVKPRQALTFFDNVKSSLSSPLFTADLRPQEPGSYDFGYIDKSKYSGSINYTPVSTSKGFWEFTSSGYAVGDGTFKSQNIDAIADTGTTLFLTSDDIVSAYYAKVNGAQNSRNVGGYIFPCSNKLPDFTFGVGKYRAVISGDLINFAPNGDGTCFGGIQSDQGLGISIFGDIMFKSQFVVFDGSKPQLGFANKP